MKPKILAAEDSIEARLEAIYAAPALRTAGGEGGKGLRLAEVL
jgi:hypothetical protein